ncbi:MFS transporter [Methylovirgula sp. 4M-Z18]|uniref:MFS transporter n=1 Tax=Methylovirgula sp. 4M-Z18 TaxID=2293567 RepID=UPI000E2EB706|nr:MFS transporter [Methylovirgula sp. 4M-Z18]RFB78583.1 MFS transporter [Methylovirgula sp. 4M-Z18]
MLSSFSVSPHRAVQIVFAIFGSGSGLWAGAIPSVLRQAHLTPALYGQALTLYAVAYIAAMSSVGRLSRHFSLRRILCVGVPLLGLVVPALVMSPSSLICCVLLVAFGLTGGLVDSTMNAEGTKVEADMRRPVLAGLHGMASFGICLPALLGSLLAVEVGLGAVAAIALILFAYGTMVVWRSIPERGLEHSSAAARAGIGRPGLALSLLGLAIGISITGEMAAATWSAKFLEVQAPGLAALAGAGTAFFAAFQVAIRLLADRLRTMVSDYVLIVASFVIALVGFGVVACDLGFAASVLGFALIGFGTGAIVPCGFALAVARSSLPAAATLSFVAMVSAVPRLPAPFIIGELSARYSFAAAFIFLTGLFAAALLIMFALGIVKAPATQSPAPQPAIEG